MNWKFRKEQGKRVQQELDETKRHMQEMELQKKREQLNALQSQINPHFLYNTLDTIRGMAVEQEAFEIADIVGTLSSMFKYSMDYTCPVVALRDEILHLKRYLKIQEMRFPGRFSFEQVGECQKQDLYETMIPKFALQPIVENAFSHGLRGAARNGKITIRYIRAEKEIRIIVSDNGMGIPDDKVLALNREFRRAGCLELSEESEKETKDGTGIALKNIDMRIKMYCGEQYGLYIASTMGLGTDVTLTLPDWRMADEKGNFKADWGISK